MPTTGGLRRPLSLRCWRDECSGDVHEGRGGGAEGSLSRWPGRGSIRRRRRSARGRDRERDGRATRESAAEPSGRSERRRSRRATATRRWHSRPGRSGRPASARGWPKKASARGLGYQDGSQVQRAKAAPRWGPARDRAARCQLAFPSCPPGTRFGDPTPVCAPGETVLAGRARDPLRPRGAQTQGRSPAIGLVSSWSKISLTSRYTWREPASLSSCWLNPPDSTVTQPMPAARAACTSQTLSPTARARRGSI